MRKPMKFLDVKNGEIFWAHSQHLEGDPLLPYIKIEGSYTHPFPLVSQQGMMVKNNNRGFNCVALRAGGERVTCTDYEYVEVEQDHEGVLL